MRWLTAHVVTDRLSTDGDGSKARYAPPLHDARRRGGDCTRRRCPSVRATLDLAHLEPSVNPRSPTTHDASLQTRPQACGRVRGQAIETKLLASCVVRTFEWRQIEDGPHAISQP